MSRWLIGSPYIGLASPRTCNGKDQIALAAIEHYRNSHPVAIPDTGSLSGDRLATISSWA